MTPLPLQPFPSTRADEPHTPRRREEESFVDDEAILALLRAPAPSTRCHPAPHDLILSSSDDDFAGWAMPAIESPFRAMAEMSAAPATPQPTRFPTAPEPGISAAHRGQHRGWLAGIAGTITAFLLASLLLTLSRSSAPSTETAPLPASATPASLSDDGSHVAGLTP
jgi:hypothetical protein